MSERYRTEYDGEFVIISNTIKDGKKVQEREWIENPIENQHISGRAVVIGNGQSRNCISTPGEFYLVPYGERGNSVSIAAWLACFDGHKEVYLVGVDGTNEDEGPSEKKISELANIMRTYPTVQFIYVSDGKLAPDQWRQNRNFVQWKYGQFVSHCDI